MKSLKNIVPILWFVAAFLFFISGIISGNNTFVILGCSFLVLGIVFLKRGGGKDKKNP